MLQLGWAVYLSLKYIERGVVGVSRSQRDCPPSKKRRPVFEMKLAKRKVSSHRHALKISSERNGRVREFFGNLRSAKGILSDHGSRRNAGAVSLFFSYFAALTKC